MVSFLISVAIAIVMLVVIVRVGHRRPPGTPLTWGEAFVAGIWVFGLMLLVYGIIPHHWLAWADNQLQWRSDVQGIPTGPIANLKIFGQTVIHNHKLFGSPDDIAFLGFMGHGRGRVQVNAQILRDIIATLIYAVALVGNVVLWLWWQRRKPAETVEKAAVSKESAFGRPVTQEA